jgi:hypothetical protein
MTSRIEQTVQTANDDPPVSAFGSKRKCSTKCETMSNHREQMREEKRLQQDAEAGRNIMSSEKGFCGLIPRRRRRILRDNSVEFLCTCACGLKQQFLDSPPCLFWTRRKPRGLPSTSPALRLLCSRGCRLLCRKVPERCCEDNHARAYLRSFTIDASLQKDDSYRI